MAQSRKKRKCSTTHSCKAPGVKFPINGLPTEMLLRILLLSCDVNSVKIFDKAVLEHPLLAVCRRWRDLILKAPQFWRNITFKIAVHAQGYTDAQAKISFQRSMFALRQVEKQIELVKNAPANIDLKLCLHHSFQKQSDAIYEAFTRLFRITFLK
jgi:hypothetical protein